MTVLYELIGVATDVTDMTITQLTNSPKSCESIVQRVQDIGKVWDEHPDWHGRNWYVQILLAVASLSRVVEWWDAEKQFWNFDDNDVELDEPLAFVMKPAEQLVVEPPSPTKPATTTITEDDENRLRLSRPTSQGRKSRDEMPKALLSPTGADGPGFQDNILAVRPPPKPEVAESARVLANERLRLQAETAQNQNIVMELSLDGDHIIWVNYAWRVVIGYVTSSSSLLLSYVHRAHDTRFKE